ncbi:MAG: pilus (MSHA type) biogenesis protein MshL [Nitrospirae bacterium]|nr:pilus (MSHA type) biogenesis protein MshL [Nitrospirota bacterium]
MKKLFHFFCVLCSVLCILLLISCASAQKAKETKVEPIVLDQTIEKDSKEQNMIPPATPEPAVPEFIPVKEASSPLQTKMVSVAARNTPLREVLFTIAETANFNLVMERGVDTEIPVTMTLKNISVEDALHIIMDSVDYLYSIKDNIMTISAMGTEIFELGHPNVIQEYKIKAGGDILSGTSSASAGSGGGNAVSGDVSIQSESDKTSFSFWDAVEKSLDTLLKSQNAGQRKIQPSFTVNRMAGTVMVTAAKKDLERVGAYINNLKKVLNRQVFIEARIVEVQLSKGLKYGIDWNYIAQSVMLGGKINFGTEKFTSAVDSNGPNFQIAVTENKNFSFLLRALQEQGDVSTLSNPRINIMNGQTALLSVGRNTSFVSRVETTTTTGTTPTTTFTVETNSVLSGIIFGIVPYIHSNGEITLTITPIISNLVELDSKSIGTGGNSIEIKLPTVDLREMSTTVNVLDGQMIIIGGLIDKKGELEEEKVPILGDIPILGALFKSVDKVDEKTELVIMLIPRLVS